MQLSSRLRACSARNRIAADIAKLGTGTNNVTLGQPLHRAASKLNHKSAFRPLQLFSTSSPEIEDEQVDRLGAFLRERDESPVGGDSAAFQLELLRSCFACFERAQIDAVHSVAAPTIQQPVA